MIVETEQSIPISQIRNRSLLTNMISTHREIDYHINNMFITETNGNNTEVISSVGKKRKVNITVTGQIKNEYNSNDFRLLRNGRELYNTGVKRFNLKDNTLNITYYNVRVRNVYDNESNCHIRKLYIDNTHSFYNFLRPILINQGLIDSDNTGNIKLKPDDIKDNFNVLITLKGIEKNYNEDTCRVKHMAYQVKCKKGDNDGE